MALLVLDKKGKEQAAKIQAEYEERKNTIAPKRPKASSSLPFTITKPKRCACGKKMSRCNGECEALELETLEGENDYVQRNL